MSSGIYTARCVLQTNEEIEICPAYKNVQPFTKQLSWCDVASYTALSLRALSISSMHAASGLFSWTMELLAFASRQFSPETMDLSVRFIRSHFGRFFLVSGRSGRRREAPRT